MYCYRTYNLNKHNTLVNVIFYEFICIVYNKIPTHNIIYLHVYKYRFCIYFFHVNIIQDIIAHYTIRHCDLKVMICLR